MFNVIALILGIAACVPALFVLVVYLNGRVAGGYLALTIILVAAAEVLLFVGSWQKKKKAEKTEE